MKKITIILVASLTLYSCKKEESPMCEVLRVELREMYENDLTQFENSKIEYWEEMDRLDCDRRKVKTSWHNIQTN